MSLPLQYLGQQNVTMHISSAMHELSVYESVKSKRMEKEKSVHSIHHYQARIKLLEKNLDFEIL